MTIAIYLVAAAVLVCGCLLLLMRMRSSGAYYKLAEYRPIGPHWSEFQTCMSVTQRERRTAACTSHHHDAGDLTSALHYSPAEQLTDRPVQEAFTRDDSIGPRSPRRATRTAT